MSGVQEQRAILGAELYWFGGGLSAPKVYDTGTNFHAPPTLRDTAVSQHQAPQHGANGKRRRIRAHFNDDHVWTVEIIEA